ncbi:MAG: hypothetical protein PF450_01735 [Bacteroidales bacterium]|jgi:hypothetical protein|nr:hypothetical protein [Bacteroidales bacterium]
MGLKKDIIETEFRTTGAKNVQSQISKVEGDIKRLNSENQRLLINKTKLEAQGKKNTKAWKALDTQIKNNKKSIGTYKVELGELNSKLKITDKTAQQLTKDKRELARELNKTSKALNPEKWNKLNKQYKETVTQLTKVRSGVKSTNKTMQLMKSLLPVAGVAALFGAVKKLATELWGLTKIIQGDAVRSSVVFGDQLGYVREESKKLAAQMGLTNREFVAAAAGTADLLIPLDFNRKQAANMSVELQSLAGALDEWTGGQLGAKEVSNILTKAMLGENEQLKQLGIAIRKDTDEFRDLVKQKLATTNATKVQAEAMATLQLIQQKSADAQTAYTREGNKLLRFQKEASVRVKNLKEKFISLFDVPVKKQLEEERNEVSLLSAKLLDSNTSYEDRLKIMKQLELISPDIVEGIDAEKISYDQLNKNLIKYNEELAKRIVLANLQEEEEKAAAKLATQLQNLTKAQADIQRLIVDQGRGDILQTYDTWEERLAAIKAHMDSIVSKQIESGKAGKIISTSTSYGGSTTVDTRTDEQKALTSLSAYTQEFINATNKYDKKLEEQLDFSARINAMKELLGLTDAAEEEIDDVDDPLSVEQKILLWEDIFGRRDKLLASQDKIFGKLHDEFTKSIDAELEAITLEMEADAELFDQKTQKMVDIAKS